MNGSLTVNALVVFLAWIGFLHASQGQEGYRIAFDIENLGDTICYLANYFGDKTYLADTASVKEGAFVFSGKEKLDKGMYMIAGQSKNKYLDFIVNDAQRFAIRTDTSAWIETIQVKGSPENRLFFDYILYLEKKRQVIDSVNRLPNEQPSLADPSLQKDSLIQQVDEDVKQYQRDLIENHRETFLARFLLASIEPEPYEVLIKETDPSERDRLISEYKDRYWDHFDLTDDRLLRSPLFHKRMERYLDDLIPPVPDSVIREVDLILSTVSANKVVYEYVLWYLTLKYERSKIMGFDAVFVHLAREYFETGRADFVNETVKKNVIVRAKTLEPLLIGKKAPLMVLLDTNDLPVSLYQIDKEFTVVYFWDMDCGFCKKETPVLKQIYDDYHEKQNLGVYAVCIDTSLTGWKKYIREHSLNWINVNGYLSLTPDFHDLYDIHSSPVIYILGRDKEIIAKHVSAEQVREIIRRKEDTLLNSSIDK